MLAIASLISFSNSLT
ncbi:MAG: hypothetical protein IJK19_00010 [Bacteroidales bacterium]|nr:hypothetical protein [Bacteroidales bacterium]